VSGLSEKQRELLLRVDEVLHYMWDPIGVCDFPDVRDEYSSYAQHVLSMLIRGDGEEAISEYLRNIRVVNMGVGKLPHNSSEDEVAQLLVDWKELIFP
jgi:hypothetical protein